MSNPIGYDIFVPDSSTEFDPEQINIHESSLDRSLANLHFDMRNGVVAGIVGLEDINPARIRMQRLDLLGESSEHIYFTLSQLSGTPVFIGEHYPELGVHPDAVLTASQSYITFGLEFCPAIDGLEWIPNIEESNSLIKGVYERAIYCGALDPNDVSLPNLPWLTLSKYYNPYDDGSYFRLEYVVEGIKQRGKRFLDMQNGNWGQLWLDEELLSPLEREMISRYMNDRIKLFRRPSIADSIRWMLRRRSSRH